MYTILVCDDEKDIVSALRIYLTAEGYNVLEAFSGLEALHILDEKKVDLVLMDIMMPEMDGISAVAKIREQSNIPVLFLTAKSEVEQRVEGLDAGADDYLPKPFATTELLARTRAMLRRRDSFVPDLLSRGGVALNRSTYQLSFGGRLQPLGGKEFQLAEMLMEKPGMVVPTETFITHIWGWDADVDTSIVWVHISNLRKKLAALGAPLEIRFVRGAGYILEEKP